VNVTRTLRNDIREVNAVVRDVVEAGGTDSERFTVGMYHLEEFSTDFSLVLTLKGENDCF
jgi:hypothetical protein